MNIVHQHFAKFLRSAFFSFIDFIFPPTCLCCNVLMEDSRRKVCESCWSSIERITVGHPLLLDTRQKLLESGVVDDLVSCFVFEKEGAFQKIAHALKYEGYESLGVELGVRLGATVKEHANHIDYVVPIPLHRAKLRERSYNQAELIARGVVATIGAKLRTDIVRRKKHTKSQTRLDLEERKENMDDAFEVSTSSAEEIRDKSILLVDDVITTGATIVSCAHKLLTAGASHIAAASAALARKDAQA